MHSSDFKLIAKEKLQGRRKKATLLILCYFAIMFILGFIVGIFGENNLIGSILSLIFSIIQIPIIFGLINSFYSFYKDIDVKPFEFLSYGFNNFGRAWKISLRIILKIIIPLIIIFVLLVFISFCSIVAGSVSSTLSSETSSVDAISSISSSLIIFLLLSFIAYIASFIWIITKIYYYQLSYFIAIDDNSLTPKEAIERSKELMTGKRWNLFCLQFSFIGWFVLEFIILFVGNLLFSSVSELFYPIYSFIVNFIFSLYLVPYMQLSTIAFYEKVKKD